MWERAPYATQVNFSEAETLHDAFQLMSTMVSLPPIGVPLGLTSWLLWNIWIARNLLTFENRQTTAASVVSKACSSGREWLQAQVPKTTQQQPALLEFETPLVRTDVTLCNSDAAWSSVTHRAGLGWYITNQDGEVIQEHSHAMEHVSSPLIAEALALRDAVVGAKRLSLSKVWFRTDSRELARAIFSKSYPVELFGVLMDIEILSSSFSFCFISFVGRENNIAADSLAKAALLCFSPAMY
ncbi:Ribonuclease H domain-containing protein [Hirschfeldia incana]|nr:Ribonuclease H domain-containing protein [Hirschfeldia incana]